MSQKSKNFLTSVILCTAIISGATNISSATASSVIEDEEKPPSLEINIPAEEEEDNDAPPSLNINIPEPEKKTPPITDKIQILNADVFPKGFNPNISKTKISYELSKKAKVEVKILDHTGQAVVTLIDNISVDADKYYVEWNGTKSNKEGGQTVAVGTYKYKIDAKNPDTGETEDTETGDINVIYPANQPQQPVTTTQPPQPQPVTTTQGANGQSSSQAAATMAIQNSQNGKTAGTGPGIALYALLPLGGLILTRKKK